MGKKEPSHGADRIPEIVVLMIWAGAFLFLLNGERYRYYLGPAFGVSLVIGFLLSTVMGVALGKNKAPGPAVSRIDSIIRALVLVLPLIYAIMTGGAVLDSQTFAKRWVGSLASVSFQGETGTVESLDEMGNGDDAELVEAYRASGPPKVPRAFRRMPGLRSIDKPLPETSTNDRANGVVEADLCDLTEYADRFEGTQVITEGMVAWDKSDTGRFYLFRFLVVCCIADAQPVAVLVEHEATERPRQNAWVRVEGIAKVAKADGQTILIIRKASVTSIQRPKNPYLY